MSDTRVPFRMSSERGPLKGPGGKNLIVHLVVAIEHWRFDDKVPRHILPAPHGIQPVPDVPNYSWAEYGMRCGLPRLLKVLGERGVLADACINASVFDKYPSVCDAVLKAGWEFQGHGYHQRALGEEGEGELIQMAVDKLRSFTGVKPRGWIGPGLRETFETPDHLTAAGIEYTCDWVIDDLPNWMATKNGPLAIVPYTLDLNDSVIYAVEKHSSPEMYNRLLYTLETFDEEVKEQPRVLTLALHHHLMGVPHRIGFVAKMLDLLMARSDTVFLTGGQILDWFIEEEARTGAARS